MSDDTSAELIDGAGESLRRLEARFDDLDDVEGGLESLADEFDDDELEEIIEDLGNVVAVLDEAEDVLETLDLADLPEAIDFEEVLEAIEVGEIPEFLADDERDVGDVVDLRQLFRAVNLLELWSSTDLREFWHEKGEFDEAVDGLTDEAEESEAEDNETLIDEAVNEAAEMADGDGDDEGMMDEAVDDFKEGAKDAYGSAEQALEDGDLDEYQVIIQRQALEGIDKFRDALVETHGKFQELYEDNRKRMRRTDKSTHSRNPTAASTMTIDRSDMGGVAGKYSTVPQAVKYSTAPNRRRIYGKRFEQELEKRRRELEKQRGENDE